MSLPTSDSEKKKVSVWEWLGFGQCQVTVREFAILLGVGLFIYVVLHLCYFTRPRLSPEAEEVRQLVLKEITETQDNIRNKLVSTAEKSPSATPTSEVSITPSPQASQEPTATPSTSPTTPILPQETEQQSSSKQILFREEKVQNWKQQLEIFSQGELSQKSQIKTILDTILTKNRELNQTTDPEKIKSILNDIQAELIILKGFLSETPLFWTGNLKWAEVIFWSLFGTLILLIKQTADLGVLDFLGNEDQTNNENEKQENERLKKKLVAYKSQYYSFLLQSPFIALIILWMFSNASFSLIGVSLALETVSIEVLISLAFILGYFNKVALTQIDLIVASLFTDAWKRTLRKIEITPLISNINYGEHESFYVIPDVKVKWSIISKPPVGIIDTTTGMFIAPPKEYYYDENNELKPWSEFKLNVIIKQVIIKAEREDEASVSTLALITLIETPVETPVISPVISPVDVEE